MKVVKNITDLIGETPMIEIEGKYTTIYAKLESFNPASCVKERIALTMIEDAIKRGLINSGTTLIKPTSGNTGISLAMVAACKSLRLILTMPENMSAERRELLKLLGAELVLTDKVKGMNGAIERAMELNQEIPNSIVFDQFSNPSNPEAHYRTTAREIIQQTNGMYDIFVAGVGTGGTLSGTAKALREQNKNVRIVAVEPSKSPVISGGNPAPHALQGIGAGFIPKNLDLSLVDQVITVDDEKAIETLKEFAKTKGILMGVSSGAALWAAMQLANQSENKGQKIVVILPDSAERYLSTLT